MNIYVSKDQVAIKYLKGLHFHIQDEMAMLKLHSVCDFFLYLLEAEENHDNKSKGKMIDRKVITPHFRVKRNISRLT